MLYRILVALCLLFLWAIYGEVDGTPQIEVVMNKLIKSIAEEQVSDSFSIKPLKKCLFSFSHEILGLETS